MGVFQELRRSRGAERELQGAAHVWDVWSSARSSSLRVFSCDMQNFIIFQQIPRVAREATAGLVMNLTHIFNSYFELQDLF